MNVVKNVIIQDDFVCLCVHLRQKTWKTCLWSGKCWLDYQFFLEQASSFENTEQLLLTTQTFFLFKKEQLAGLAHSFTDMWACDWCEWWIIFWVSVLPILVSACERSSYGLNRMGRRAPLSSLSYRNLTGGWGLVPLTQRPQLAMMMLMMVEEEEHGGGKQLHGSVCSVHF